MDLNARWAVAPLVGMLAILVSVTAKAEDTDPSGQSQPAAEESPRSTQASVVILASMNAGRASRTPYIRYHVVPAGGSGTVHIYVDDKERGKLPGLKGAYSLQGLKPGRHDVTLKVVDANRVTTGEASTTVLAK